MNDVVVGVDGGGSKTDVLVADSAGKILSRAAGPGCSLHRIGVPGAASVVDTVVQRALRGADRSVTDVRTVHCYLTAVDLPDETAALRDQIAGYPWAHRPVVGNDLFALLRSGTDSPDAAVVVCGTGINAAAVRADGRQERFLALGTVSGDWGGGTGLAEAAVWACARAEDGRGPHTALRAPLLELAGTGSVELVSIALHVGRLDLGMLAPLAPHVLRLAAQGDAVAKEIRDRQGTEVATMAATLLGRLELVDRVVPVVLGGGILRAQDPGLHARVVSALAEQAPLATAVVADCAPVLGALLLALGDDPALTATARTSYRAQQPTLVA